MAQYDLLINTYCYSSFMLKYCMKVVSHCKPVYIPYCCFKIFERPTMHRGPLKDLETAACTVPPLCQVQNSFLIPKFSV